MKLFSKLNLHPIIAIFASATVILTSPLSVHAILPSSTLDFFDQSGIYYYNPMGSAASCIPGSTASYNSSDVFSSAEWEAIQNNKRTYQDATTSTNISWAILAAIHSIENNASQTNPSDTRGVYGQPLSSKDQSFEDQSKEFAKHLSDLVTSNQLNLSLSSDIKRLFFIYNGEPDEYIQKALDLGFSDKEAHNGEGSPYVMNRYDAQRDPTSSSMNPKWKGFYTSDGRYNPNATFNGFGAYPRYTALGGAVTNNECYSAGIVAGGATSSVEALQIMQSYILTNCSELSQYGISCDSSSVFRKANCVSFVRYFLNRYTDIHVGTNSIGNGRDVVNTLRFAKGLSTGNYPRPYAVFSSSRGEYGHTGIVLGIDTTKGLIYIGQMDWYESESFGLNHITYDLKTFTQTFQPTYAYLDGHLKGL